MDIPELRGWLLRQPRPTTVKVVTLDDQHHEVSIDPGVSWMALAQSIHALSPDRIEAYDKDGKVLRAVRPLEATAGPEHIGTAAPLVLPPGSDPQAVLLLHFADLLAGAYRHSTEVAFERLVGLFEAVNARSESLERSLDTTHKLLRRAYQEQIDAEPPAEKGDLLQEMVQGFVSATQHAPNGNGNGAPNGKAG